MHAVAAALLASLILASRVAQRPDLELRAHFGKVFLGLENGRREWIDAAGRSIDSIASTSRAAEAPGARCTWRALSSQLAGRFEEADFESEEAARLDARIRFTPLRTAAVPATFHWWLALLRGYIEPAVSRWEEFRTLQPTLVAPRVRSWSSTGATPVEPRPRDAC